jgi:hypothetical protein
VKVVSSINVVKEAQRRFEKKTEPGLFRLDSLRHKIHIS